VQLTTRDLNRTLLARQHLLARVDHSVDAMAEHLVGLQAQENLPPYLSLAARLTGFDPHAVTRGLEDKSLARLVTMRGTIHLLTAGDALTLRQWTQPCQERERKASQTIRPALHVEGEEFTAALDAALAGGPLPMKVLGEVLAASFPGVPPTALAQLARVTQPLAQLPPRGAWKQSGGVVLQRVDTWLGQPLRSPDPASIVRRYLHAFGPATAADIGAWSGLTGMASVIKDMPDLVRHTGPDGKQLYDVADGVITAGDTHAPVRLLGTYDNVWLSHAARDRVTDPVKRKSWMGTNGGMANTVFVNGMLEGLWRVEDGRPVVVELLRKLTADEQRDLDGQLERVAELLSR
jgi:hypothetical protein